MSIASIQENKRTNSNGNLLVAINLISGGMAGATALIFTYPFELARTRYF